MKDIVPGVYASGEIQRLALQSVEALGRHAFENEDLGTHALGSVASSTDDGLLPEEEESGGPLPHRGYPVEDRPGCGHARSAGLHQVNGASCPARCVDPLDGGHTWTRAPRGDETVRVGLEVEQTGGPSGPGRWHESRGQHHRIEAPCRQLTCEGVLEQDLEPRTGQGLDRRGA